jgi:hypothetical protein
MSSDVLRPPVASRGLVEVPPAPPGGATIAVSITHGFQARNLLQTDVGRRLVAAGYRLAVISPAADDPGFRASVQLPDAAYVAARPRPGRLAAFFGTARRYALANPKRNATYNLFSERYLTSRHPQYLTLRALNRLVGRWAWLRDAWLRLESLLISGRELEPLLRDLRPALLVTGTPGTEYLDALLLRCARRLGIANLCVVLSWDNLTSKGYMAARPDRLVVWNERMREEAVELHDYRPGDVEVAGVAHFDIYQRPDALLSRADVCRRLGIDPARPIVLFGTVSPFLFPQNHEIAELLGRAAADGRLANHAQVVVRLHPQAAGKGQYGDVRERYEALRRSLPQDVALDVPQVETSGLQWSLPPDEMVWLASLLHESGVVVNVASTLAIDAALSRRPIIGVAFDGRQRLPYPRSIRRAYDYTHYRPIMETGGAPIAESEEELITMINRYLADPTLDTEGRERMAREQAEYLDGRSGARVARAIAGAARRGVS